MSSILWIELEGFYVAHHPPSDLPLLITRDRCVLDANAAAQTRGVVPGMPVRQAKAIVLKCHLKEWQADRYEQKSKEWLDLCSRFSGVIEPADQHSAAIDLSR